MSDFVHLARVYGYAWPLWHGGGDLYALDEAQRVGQRLAAVAHAINPSTDVSRASEFYRDTFRGAVTMMWGYYLSGSHWVRDPALEPHEEMAFRAALIPVSLADTDAVPVFRLLPAAVRDICRTDYYRRHSPAPVVPPALKAELEALTGITVPSGWDPGGEKLAEHHSERHAVAGMVRRAMQLAAKEGANG